MRGTASTRRKEMADVHYCLTFAHDPGTFHSTKKKIVVPGDVKGMKVRPANATIARFVTLLGGTNVQASAPEVARRAGEGRRRGDHLPVGLDRAVRHRQGDEVSPRCGVLRHRAGLGDQQGQVRGAVGGAEKGDRRSLHAANGRDKIAAPWADFEAAGRDKIKAQAGHELDPLTPAQLAEWRKAAEPLYAEWAENAKKAGYNPDEIMKDLKDSLTKYKSLY